MKKHTFCWNEERKEWAETHISAFSADDESSLPIVLLVDKYERSAGESRMAVWCGKHQAYEEIAGYAEDGVLTDRGCRETGLVVSVPDTLYDPDIGERRFRDGSPYIHWKLRWQVRYRPGENSILLSCDDVELGFEWKKDGGTGRLVNVPFVRAVERRSQTLSPCAGKAGNAPGYLLAEMGDLPAAIAPVVLSCLAEAAESVYGFRPPLLLPPEGEERARWRLEYGKEWVNAFLSRPFDMNIYFFRNHFKTSEEFDRQFPPDQRDYLNRLCEALGVRPSDALRDAYRNDPAFFVARIVLPRIGVNDERLIEMFRGIHAFCGEDMQCLYTKRPFLNDRQKAMLKDLHVFFVEDMRRYIKRPLLYMGDDAELKKQWDALRFYCAWRSSSEGPEAMARRLLAAQPGWEQWKWTGMIYFQKYFDVIPQGWMEEILRDGITTRVFNELILLDLARTSRQPGLSYGEAARARECNICGYDFRLVPSVRAFHRLIRNLPPPRKTEHISERSELYVIERNGWILFYIFVEDGAVRWSDCRTGIKPPLDAKLRVAFLLWKRRFSLSDLNNEDQAPPCGPLPEPVVGPVTVDEWEGMSLLDMIDAPKDSIRRGYFLSLNRKLAEVELLRSAPLRADEDEREALTQRFPFCQRLFDAAWSEDPEAQYVMSLLYRHDSLFNYYSDARRSALWYQRACENGWREIMPSKQDIRLDELPLRIRGETYDL